MKQLLIILFSLFQLSLFAQEGTTPDKYLAGAVPVVDGKVVFSKSYNLLNLSPSVIFDAATNWLNENLEKNQESRIVISSPAEGSIVALNQQTLLFSSKALSIDRTTINYRIEFKIIQGKCTVEIKGIKYLYYEAQSSKPTLYRAETWITDEEALTKKNTQLSFSSGKFRVKTIDMVNTIFVSLENTFNKAIVSSNIN